MPSARRTRGATGAGPDAPAPGPRDPEDLRRFVHLVDLRAAARDKEHYWRDWKKRHGPAGGIRIADELRRQVIAQKPSFPGERDRQDDLETHLRVIEALHRLDAWRRSAPP